MPPPRRQQAKAKSPAKQLHRDDSTESPEPFPVLDNTEAAERLRRINAVNAPKPTSSGQRSLFYIEPRTACAIFFALHVLAAIYAPIQDCDEVFNYYEPTHYLTYGYGLQTWEYSPEYAIRSWTYIVLHAVPMGLARLVPFVPTKVFQFYFVRLLLGLVCAICESRLYSKISTTFSPRVGVFFLLIMLTSPGMFHASISFLPSSFSMYTTMLGMSAFMDWRGGLRTATGIMWICSGALLGWPFAAAMIIPFALEELLLAVISGQSFGLYSRVLDGSVRSLLVLALQGCIDGFFYKELVNVPFNIVRYNVLAARNGKGPNIYGVEPWHFYLRNLILNFNIWALIALASMPLLLAQRFMLRQAPTKTSWLRGMIFLSPFYLWLAIFTLQPHKEERFMYPAYPALALNAAVGIHLILAHLGSANPRNFTSAIPVKLRFAFVTFCFMFAVNLGVWRTVGMVTAYGAPLNVYKPLRQPGVSRPGDTVCLGKEWYRFPSSFHLPNGVKAKFVRSHFSGLLPGEFSEAGTGFGLYPGAWLIPPGMNDENREDAGKYVSSTCTTNLFRPVLTCTQTHLSHCSFLVDSSFPGVEPTPMEPDHVHNQDTWEQLACEPFLDVSQTGIIGRLGWVPDWDFIPAKYRRKWGEYCLLRRKKPMN